jgi:hypothetical protein
MIGQLAAELFQDREIDDFQPFDPTRLAGYFQQPREEDTPLGDQGRTGGRFVAASGEF